MEQSSKKQLIKEMSFAESCSVRRARWFTPLICRALSGQEDFFPAVLPGITILLQQIADTFAGISIPYTVLYVPLNLIPIYIGIRYLGKRFTFYSVYVILLSSFMTDILPSVSITYDVLLICIFGGILNGVAISLCLFVGASAGGTDFISIYFSQKAGHRRVELYFHGQRLHSHCSGIAFRL